MKPITKHSFLILLVYGLGFQSPNKVNSSASLPNANEILERVVKHPSISYKGRITITRWFGKKSRSEEAQVFYSYPNQFRWNFLKPDGSIDRIVIGDGKIQLVYIPNEKAFVGEAPGSKPKAISQNEEWSLLYSNYQVSILKEDEIIDRPVWLLELKPLFSGKPSQHLMIDKETYAVLENRRFRPKGGKIAALTRFVSFEPQEEIPVELFQINEDDKAMAAAVHELDPDYLDYKEALKPVNYEVPETLPNGFIFESGGMLNVEGEAVGHYRYTDGLAIISLFVSDLPVRMKSNSESSVPLSREIVENPIILTTSGRVMTKKGQSNYYTLIGDLSKKILQNAFSQLK